MSGLGLVGGRPPGQLGLRESGGGQWRPARTALGFGRTAGWVRLAIEHYRMCRIWKSGLYTDDGACYFLLP